MESLGLILLATAVFRVVTYLTTLLSPTSTDLMTQEANILSRRPGRQCLVTLMRERLLYTRPVVTRERLLLIYMRTATRFATDIRFPTTIMIAYRLIPCDTMKSTQVATAGLLTQVVMVLFITSSLAG
ncbi:hypothetical protein DFJ58DRAFT_757470 [Suillus subalutaceus]|uniref:uncharacterized protein n=1 Tax=Suillus subalutaceus TaxID=48586 RepID=UPI001B86EA6F|nr:uncharacterized protein DFJ58DRAFT_757470 [Suillus subalutaceus]KAG1874521.1 hypothetical protein DFJ58DRAFT_757470 [Suillus subalutaceus]